MGDWFQVVVDQEVGEAEAEPLAAEVFEWLTVEEIIAPDSCGRGVKGDEFARGPQFEKATGEVDHDRSPSGPLEIVTKRTTFHTGCLPFNLICSKCSAVLEWDRQWQQAIDEWFHNNGPAIFVCSVCEFGEAIDQWQHEPTWGFGNLGFWFWSWPTLTDDFVHQLGSRLGHETRFVVGKI